MKVVTIPIVASVIFSLILLYDLYVLEYRGMLAFGFFETTKMEPRGPGTRSPISLLENYPKIATTDLGKTSSPMYNNIASSKSSGAQNGSTTSQTLTQSSSGSNTLEYTSRFICGTITGENGPLRPGRYNSDINIFNRQNFPVSFLWKATLNGDTRDHNYNIQNLGPGKSTSIYCTQILNSIPGIGNASSEKYYEGVLTINVDLDPSILSAISSSKGGVAGVISGSEATSVLSVDAIYTVNALKVSNREIIVQLIEYTINGRSSKIPSDMISKVLSLAVPIKTNETINPDKQIRSILTREFSMTPAETAGLNITIRGLSLGVGALDDNHALSLERVNPYQPPS